MREVSSFTESECSNSQHNYTCEFAEGLLEMVHDPVVVLDRRLVILAASHSFYQFFGLDRETSKGKTLSEIAHHSTWDVQRLQELIARSFENDAPVEAQYEVEGRPPLVGRRILLLNSRCILQKGSGGCLLLLAIKDITQLIQAEQQLQQEIQFRRWTNQELREREELFRNLVEIMNDGFVVQNARGTITYANKKIFEMLGYSRDEVIGRSVEEVLDEPNLKIYRDQVIQREKGMQESYEMSLTARDGRRLFVIISPKPLFSPDGEFIGSFAVVTDITARKTIEAALRSSEQKLRLVSEHLLLAREKERERISRELHDELGQDLTVLKYQTRFIERKLRKDQKALKEACAEIIKHLDEIMVSVRRIAKDMSPALLEDLGLTASLRRLVDETARHSPAQILSEIQDVDGLLSKDVQVNLYRIVQEALNNCMKHSRASRISVLVQLDGSRIVCLVADDGLGWNQQEANMKVSSSGGLGLPIMEERARMIGGRLLVKSHPNTGTEVRLIVPVVLDEE